MNRRIYKKLQKRGGFRHYTEYYRKRWDAYLSDITTTWRSKGPSFGADKDCVVLYMSGGRYKRRRVLGTYILTGSDAKKACALGRFYGRNSLALVIHRHQITPFQHWLGGLNTSHNKLISEGDKI